MTVFVDFVKLINDGLGPLSKCTRTLKTKLHPYVFKTKKWYINPKGTQQKSELQKRTNLCSKKNFWRNQLKSTVLQDSPKFYHASPEDSAQWFPRAVTNWTAAPLRRRASPWGWIHLRVDGVQIPPKTAGFSKMMGLGKGPNRNSFLLMPFLGVCKFISSGVSTCFGTDKLQYKWKPSAIFNLMFFGFFHLLWEKFLRNCPKPRYHNIKKSHAPQYGPMLFIWGPRRSTQWLVPVERLYRSLGKENRYPKHPGNSSVNAPFFCVKYLVVFPKKYTAKNTKKESVRTGIIQM